MISLMLLIFGAVIVDVNISVQMYTFLLVVEF